MVHYRGGRAAIDEAVYPELEAFWADLTAAYREEVRRLGELGCTYLQLDDTSLAYLNDPEQRAFVAAQRRRRRAPARAVHRERQRRARRPAGGHDGHHAHVPRQLPLVVGGRGRLRLRRRGALQRARRRRLLPRVRRRAVRRRSSRCASCPKGKQVVLGLVTTKRGELETKDELKRRIDEASKYVDARPALPLAPVRVLLDGRGQRADVDEQVGQAAAGRRDRRGGLGLALSLHPRQRTRPQRQRCAASWCTRVPELVQVGDCPQMFQHRAECVPSYRAAARRS